MEKEIKTLGELFNEENNFVIISIDETEYWRHDIKDKAIKIDSIYLVNLNEPTNLCSPVICFPAVHIKNIVQNFEAFNEDELHEIEYQEINNEALYFEINDSFEIKKIIKDSDITENEIIENEYANPCC